LGQLTGGQAGSIRPVPWGDRLPPWVAELLGTATGPPARRGRLIGVCGPGGTGASVVAMALAQGLAPSEDVLLADFARRAHQSLLHRISGGAGGLLGLLTRFRGRSPSTAEVRASTLPLAGQRYRLLPGLDRVHHWALVNPRSFDTGLSALQAEFELVIADITGDFEGEADTGSLEVEERNHVSRRVALRADLVVVVGGTGRTTRHAAAETLESLSALGVNAARMLTATNRVSSSRGTGGNGLSLPEVVLTEDGPLPASLVVPLREAALAALRRLPSPPEEVRFHPVVPGTIGRWGEPA